MISQEMNNTHIRSHKLFSGFTLVELIVVITILAILGTIGFISIQWYSSSARDSSRISNLVNLQKWLTFFQVAGWTFPMPENPITVFASGTLFGYQWFARDQVASIAKLSAGATKDPLDPSIYTTYAVNAVQTKMQLMSFLEDGSKVTAMLDAVLEINRALAATSASYATRTPMTKGDSIGILIGTGSNLNQPVQELLTATFTGIDIASTSTGYTIYLNKTQQFSGTGMALKAAIAGDGLVGYWSFDEGAGTTAYDRSGNGNNATLWGTALPAWTVGKVGGWLNFSNGYTSAVTSGICNNAITMVAWVKTSSTKTYQWIIGSSIMEKYEILLKSSTYPASLEVSLSPGNFVQWDKVFPQDELVQIVVVANNGTPWKLYLNGVNKWTPNIVAGTYKVDGTQVANIDVGRIRNDSTNFSPSWMIDEVRIYNRTLSESEIQTLYNASK